MAVDKNERPNPKLQAPGRKRPRKPERNDQKSRFRSLRRSNLDCTRYIFDVVENVLHSTDVSRALSLIAPSQHAKNRTIHCIHEPESPGSANGSSMHEILVAHWI